MRWHDMHRSAASLKDGTVTVVLLVEKLQALERKNLAHWGLEEEEGRLLGTIEQARGAREHLSCGVSVLRHIRRSQSG